MLEPHKFQNGESIITKLIILTPLPPFPTPLSYQKNRQSGDRSWFMQVRQKGLASTQYYSQKTLFNHN